MPDYLLLAVRFIAAFVVGMLILSGASLMSLAAASADAPPSLSDERQAELRNFLVQDCSSCHGLRMAGGLGPPLGPAAIADKTGPVSRGHHPVRPPRHGDAAMERLLQRGGDPVAGA